MEIGLELTDELDPLNCIFLSKSLDLIPIHLWRENLAAIYLKIYLYLYFVLE